MMYNKKKGENVKNHTEIDIQIENSAKEYAKENDYFIIDARLGWYAVPESCSYAFSPPSVFQRWI